MTLAPHLRMVVWRPKFQPHLSEKYDRTVNPTDGNEAVMANYFPIALTGMTRS
jgi:hypothetical protein